MPPPAAHAALQKIEQGQIERAIRGEQVVVDPEPLADRFGVVQVVVQQSPVASSGGRRIDVHIPAGLDVPKQGRRLKVKIQLCWVQYMEHNDVVTLFHEFGHLLHHLFAGRQKWIGVSGISTEWDFVETPSQMLEEWAWDPDVLATFAKHHETNEAIPAELVRKMRRSSEFGKGLQVRTQMSYARLSLSCHDRSPSEVNTDLLTKTIYEQYRPFKFVDGTHFQCSFGHLVDYSAVYYTYMWSLVIAKDFFSQFDSGNLFATDIARKYRDAVLTLGGSRPAAAIVKDFLGRDFSFEAWKAWLEKTN